MLISTLNRSLCLPSVRAATIFTGRATSTATIKATPIFFRSHPHPIRTMVTKPKWGPPAHEMVYFPQMTSSLAESSGDFRRVLWTGRYSQVVMMTVPVGGDIGDEVHLVDQALTFISGVGMATVNGKDQEVRAGDLIIVPAGTQHQFINTGPNPLVSLLRVGGAKLGVVLAGAWLMLDVPDSIYGILASGGSKEMRRKMRVLMKPQPGPRRASRKMRKPAW
jgi:mannose-6-phosphate isomerase-like protein (cupin superfamily)